MNTYLVSRIGEIFRYPGLTLPRPEARELSNAKLLLQNIADGTNPLMLLFIHGVLKSNLSAVVTIPDPVQVDLFDVEGKQIRHSMSRWATCRPDVETVRASTASQRARFDQHSSQVSQFVYNVVVVSRHIGSITYPGRLSDQLAIGYMYPNKVEAIDNKLPSQIREIQALLDS